MSVTNKSTTAQPVVNLSEKFGRRYQVEYEESYHAEYEPNSRNDVPELQIIPCRSGHIFPWGGTRLAASTDTRGAIANKLADLACCTPEQDGDDGITVSFDVADFREVAKLIKPRGCRRLDPQRRRAFVEAGRAHRYRVATGQTEISGDNPITVNVEPTSELTDMVGVNFPPKTLGNFITKE